MIHTRRMAWSLHDKTMDETSGNNRGEDMAQAVRSGLANWGCPMCHKHWGCSQLPNCLREQTGQAVCALWEGEGIQGTWNWRRGEEWRRVTPCRLYCFVRVGRAFVVEGGLRSSCVVVI